MKTQLSFTQNFGQCLKALYSSLIQVKGDTFTGPTTIRLAASFVTFFFVVMLVHSVRFSRLSFQGKKGLNSPLGTIYGI